jgi:murein L,D-transpeptidase YcbB/YkuD
MNKLYFLILLSILISCKKEEKAIPVKKAEPLPAIVQTDERKIQLDTSVIGSFKSEDLKKFYIASNNETVWGNLEKRTFIIDELKKSESLGLEPNDYSIKRIENFESKISKLNDTDLALYDVLLTYNFQKYLTHLHKGKLNPKKLYNDWDLNDKPFNVNTILIKAFNDNELTLAIENSQPKTYTYKRLLKALKLLNEFPDDDIKTIAVEDKVTLHDTNNAMITIKKRLLYWKDLTGRDSLTSTYDNKTFEAIKKFQTRHGLAADGVIGRGTVNALNFSKIRRKHQIISNIERWRWFADTLAENYFIINIPDYSLHVVENKDTTIVRKIVVGTNSRKTPILTSTLKTVVFNPTWTVPPTILKEDIVPAMKRNRNYLKNKNITIYSKDNSVVEPSNWNENSPGSYRYVQSPGSSNSLGLMKILFPNNHSVYLHDTNHRNLFGRNNRSLSSGCVRVENPLELAQHILDSNNWSKEKIDSIIVTKKTTNVRIAKKYAMYQWYWTAWSEDNSLQFRDDIYNLDTDLYAKLRN